jgi:hypothetical protein
MGSESLTRRMSSARIPNLKETGIHSSPAPRGEERGERPQRKEAEVRTAFKVGRDRC